MPTKYLYRYNADKIQIKNPNKKHKIRIPKTNRNNTDKILIKTPKQKPCDFCIISSCPKSFQKEMKEKESLQIHDLPTDIIKFT